MKCVVFGIFRRDVAKTPSAHGYFVRRAERIKPLWAERLRSQSAPIIFTPSVSSNKKMKVLSHRMQRRAAPHGSAIRCRDATQRIRCEGSFRLFDECCGGIWGQSSINCDKFRIGLVVTVEIGCQLSAIACLCYKIDGVAYRTYSSL